MQQGQREKVKQFMTEMVGYAGTEFYYVVIPAWDGVKYYNVYKYDDNVEVKMFSRGRRGKIIG